MTPTDYLIKIQAAESLSQDESYAAFSEILAGQWSDPAIAAFLMGLSQRGETVNEITGAARVMRENATPIKAPAHAVDCCGTGGDKSGTYNISTAVAIVAAASGACVAKHGNRSASSQSGAADVLEALGVNLDAPRDVLENALETFNFAFLMAPQHHATLRHVMPVRKALGVKTMFNIMGPLANPAKTQFQLLGVFDKDLVLKMATVLKALGTQRALVVHGSDGLDEITITGETYAAALDEGGRITEHVLTPSDFGLEAHSPDDILGGTPEVNAAALSAVLAGKRNAYRDIVLANTAAVLKITGRADSFEIGAQHAAKAIDSGKAMKLLNDYRAYTQQAEA